MTLGVKPFRNRPLAQPHTLSVSRCGMVWDYNTGRTGGKRALGITHPSFTLPHCRGVEGRSDGEAQGPYQNCSCFPSLSVLNAPAVSESSSLCLTRLSLAAGPARMLLLVASLQR